jgi:hypothetical protein
MTMQRDKSVPTIGLGRGHEDVKTTRFRLNRPMLGERFPILQMLGSCAKFAEWLL